MRQSGSMQPGKVTTLTAFPHQLLVKQPRRLWKGTYWHEKRHYSTKSRCTHRSIAAWEYSHCINSWRVRSCNHLLHILFMLYIKYWSLFENNVHWTNSSKCYHKIFHASNYQCYVEQTLQQWVQIQVRYHHLFPTWKFKFLLR